MAVTLQTNIIQDGNTMPYTNTGAAIAVGDVVVVGDRIGRAVTGIADGSVTAQTGTLQMTGVIDAPANANVTAQGGDVYWESGTPELTATAAGNTPAGQCWAVVSGGRAQVSLGPTSTPGA